MMQIRELVLYGYNGKVRHLPFSLGKVNIITGRSKSGKSAVGDIIDYCLGGDSCNIADGVVRDNVAWYGLLLQFEHERMFVARKNPDKGQQSTGYCYFEVGEKIEVPEECDFESNANVAGIEEELTGRIGISENLNVPPEGQSRLPLAANVRHALYYCIQGQDEIAAKNFLFHHQSDDFITQAIRDTLPYFLGAISEEALALENERYILNRKLKLEKRKLEENRYLMGGGSERAIALIGEARQAGIIDSSIQIDYQNYQEMYLILQDAMNWMPSDVSFDSGMDRLTFLQSRLQEIQDEYDEIGSSIDNAKRFAGETSGYFGEAQHQKMRLESIGLFEQLDFNPGRCPFCSGTLEQPLPSVEMMKASIANLDKSISNVTREQPKLRAFISELEQEHQKKREEIGLIKAEIDGLYQQLDEKKRLRDINARRGKVIGRISLWVESVESDTSSKKQEQTVKEIEERIKEIDGILDRDSVEERKQSALSRIQGDMTKWAKELRLEHCDSPYRLDLNKVTVVVDKQERPVPLKQLGSGSNWVGVHLITFFALQRFFIGANRPVPRFLFLDQPSQVYFPSAFDEKQIDWNEVSKMYQFIIDRTNELNGKLQVIIVDHANLNEESFKKFLCEDWWPVNNNLIPQDWYSEEHTVLYAEELVNLSNAQTLEVRVHSVDQLRLLYEQSSTSEELAVLYAKGLVNLSHAQTLEDCAHNVDKLRLLYEHFSTSEELAVLYANGLVNLSFRQTEEVDVQENTQRTKILLSKHHKNTELQLLYAQALFILTLKQESEALHQTVAQLREFLLAYPEVNHGFQDALDAYLNEHPDHTERYTSLRV